MCHENCFRTAELGDPRCLIGATEHTFKISREERKRRRAWMLSSMERSLDISGSRSLPAEIKRLVAEHLVQEYAVSLARSRWRRQRNFDVNFTRPIWCKFVDFEGNRYICSISNQQDEEHSHLIFSASRAINRLHVKENYLGVLELLFTVRGEIPDLHAAPGIWWRTHCVEDPDLMVTARSDASSSVSLSIVKHN